MLPILNKAATWLGKNLPKALETAQKWFKRIVPVVKTVAQWISRNRDVILPFVAALLAAFAAFKVFMFIKTVTTAVMAFNAALVANPIGLAEPLDEFPGDVLVTCAADAQRVIEAVVAAVFGFLDVVNLKAAVERDVAALSRRQAVVLANRFTAGLAIDAGTVEGFAAGGPGKFEPHAATAS